MISPKVSGRPDGDDSRAEVGARAYDTHAGAPGSVRDQRSGRFELTVSDHAALDRLAAVLRALGGDPTIAAADRALAAHTTSGPSVRALLTRFGMRWRQLRSLALTVQERRGMLIGSFQHRGEFTGTEEDISRALCAVAHRLGHPPSAIAYDIAVSEIHNEWIRQGVIDPPWLPSSATILARSRWAAALAHAGLTTTRIPSSAYTSRMVDALDRCIGEMDILPSISVLEQWALARGVRLPSRPNRPPWAHVIERARRRRRQRGETTPSRTTLPRHAPPIPKTPTLDASVGDPSPWRPEPLSGRFITHREAVLSVARYLVRYTGPNRPPRTKHYKTVGPNDPELAAYTAVARIGRFQALVAEAERLIQRQGTGQFQPGAPPAREER